MAGEPLVWALLSLAFAAAVYAGWRATQPPPEPDAFSRALAAYARHYHGCARCHAHITGCPEGDRLAAVLAELSHGQ